MTTSVSQDSLRATLIDAGYSESPILSYLQLRRSIGALGIVLPLILGPLGWLCGIPLQVNMSFYYHTALRDLFVGIMCSFGVFLFCYHGKGFERWVCLAGAFASVGIALCPISRPEATGGLEMIFGLIHVFCGTLFFLTLATFSLLIFPNGVRLSKLPRRRQFRHITYYLSGLVILLCSGAIGIHMFILPAAWSDWLDRFSFAFWMEWIAVWAFAAAWLVKGEAILGDRSRWILFDDLFQKLVPTMSSEE